MSTSVAGLGWQRRSFIFGIARVHSGTFIRHYSHGAVRKRSFLTVYAMLELACSTISKYWHQKCQLDVLLDSFRQNVHFRTMGHVTKLMFCHIKHFIAELKCVYKASLIISLHKYVNNSIYVFYPKFRKSRLLCSLKFLIFFKKGNTIDIKNYRPIFWLSNIYKPFRKIITTRLEKKLYENQPRE